MSLVNVRNCIRFYQTAEELNASTLMNYCAEIIASHWVSVRLTSVGKKHLCWKSGDQGVGPGSTGSYLSGPWFPFITKLKAKQLHQMICEILFGSKSLLVLILESRGRSQPRPRSRLGTKGHAPPSSSVCRSRGRASQAGAAVGPAGLCAQQRPLRAFSAFSVSVGHC